MAEPGEQHPSLEAKLALQGLQLHLDQCEEREQRRAKEDDRRYEEQKKLREDLSAGIARLHGRIDGLIRTVGLGVIAILLSALGFFLAQKLGVK